LTEMEEHSEIYQTADEFETIRADPRLAALLTLARIVNALNFCFRATLRSTDDKSPAGRRDYLNSFLFACGILYEGLKVANTLGKHFKDRPSFRKGFGVLLADPETKKLERTVLDPMRNKIVFHYDEDVTTTTLRNLNFESYVFLASHGEKLGEVHYRLADEVAINFIIGDPGSREQEERVLRDATITISSVLTKFVRCADELIGDMLEETNWARREV
jgi:hypothetical protein